MQHILTWFVRRHDDGPVRVETCSLIYNKYDVLDVNGFNIILVFKYLLLTVDVHRFLQNNSLCYKLCPKMSKDSRNMQEAVLWNDIKQ